MAICWHCGCEFPLNDKDGTKCPECGHDAGNTPAALGTGLIISFCLIVFQSNDGILFLGILGAIGFTIGGLCMAIKTIERNKQWKKRQNAKHKKSKQSAFKEYGTVSNLKPFVALGRDNGPDIRFDIKPDREIEIEYKDASGDITRRRVTAQIIETAWGGLVLKAYCHLRGAQRSFKLENIVRLYEDGREMYVAEWLKEIGFTNSNRVKRRLARQKVVAMVDKMDDDALNDFIKNSN